MLPHDDFANQLRLIDDHLDQAMALADGAAEPLIAALISSAREALIKRYKELDD